MNASLHFFPVQRTPSLPRRSIVAKALSNAPALIVLKAGGGGGKSLAATEIATSFVKQYESHTDSASEAQAVWIRHAPDEGTEAAFWHRIFQTLDEAGLISHHPLAKALADGGLSTAVRREILAAFQQIDSHALLIIEDAHHILTPHIEESLIEVLESTTRLSVIITTRQTPSLLTKTRARVRVPINVLNAEDLTLSPTEVRELLALRFPDLARARVDDLSAHIHRQAKGWPLATDALIIETGVPHTRTNSWRPGSFVREYVDELIRTSRPEARTALCASALFEELSINMLAIMLDLPADQLEPLVEQEFESSLGYWIDSSHTRRYRHHDLIRAELRARAHEVLGESALRNVYLRVARASNMFPPRYAKEAAIQVGDWDLLSELLVDELEFSLHRDQPLLWHTRVPERVHEQYPVIAAFALIEEYAFPSGKFGKMFSGFRLLASRTLAATSEARGFPGFTAATLRLVAARLGGLHDLASTMVDRVRDHLADLPSEAIVRRSPTLDVARTQSIITLIHMGRFTDADSAAEILLLQRDSLTPKNLVHGLALASWIKAWQGDMPAARALVQDASDLHIPVGWDHSYLGTGYRIAAALDALEMGDIDTAQAHLDALSEHEATIEHWPFLTYLSTLITESKFGPKAGLDALERQLQRRRGRSAPLAYSRRMLEVLQARLR